MQSIDIRMLSLVFLIMQSLIVSVTFGVATSNFRGMNRATAWWAFGFLLAVCGFLLIFLRGRIPDFLSIPLANTLLLVGVVMFAWGIDAYAGQRLHNRLGLAGMVVSLVVAIITSVQPSYNIRAFAVSILHMVFYAVIAVNLMRLGGGVRLQHTVVAVPFSLAAAIVWVLAVSSLFWDQRKRASCGQPCFGDRVC